MNHGIPSFLIRKLSGEEQREAENAEQPSPVGLPPTLERQRKKMIEHLGTKWLLHPTHAPKKGHYNNMGMPPKE